MTSVWTLNYLARFVYIYTLGKLFAIFFTPKTLGKLLVNIILIKWSENLRLGLTEPAIITPDWFCHDKFSQPVIRVGLI